MKFMANGKANSILGGIGLISLALGACTSQEQNQAAPSSVSGQGAGNPRYIQEAIRIKASTDGGRIEERLFKLYEEYGIQPNEGSVAPGAVLGQSRDGIKQGLGKTAGTISSGTYSPRQIYTMIIGANAGDSIEAYTSEYDANVDPVMVFFKSTAIPGGSKSALGLNYVHQLNDDYNGWHPRLLFQVSEAGNYVLQVFPYFTERQGRAYIFLRRKRSGAWSTILNGPINVYGTVHRPGATGQPSYVKADVISNSDPFVWVWNLSSVGVDPSAPAGVHSDDHSAGTYNSNTANTTVYPGGYGGLDVVLLGGYQTGGTASWEHFD